MGLGGFMFARADDFDLATASASDLRMGYLIHLPFRVRVPVGFRALVESSTGAAEVGIRNEIPLPSPESQSGWAADRGPKADPEELRSLALVLLRDLPKDPVLLASIRTFDRSRSPGLPQPPAALRAGGLAILNQFLASYDYALNSAGIEAQISSLLMPEFLTWMMCEVVAVYPGGEIPDEDFAGLFAPLGRVVNRPVVSGDYWDLSSDRIDEVRRTLQRAKDDLAIRFASDARQRLRAGDDLGAFLFAVAGLEALHASFVRAAIARAPREQVDGACANYLRVRFAQIMELTPIMLMEETERPPAELIDRCRAALELRNEIMHGKLKRASFTFLQRTAADLLTGISAIVEMSAYYERALTRRLS